MPVVWVRELGWDWQVVFALWTVCRGTEVSVALHVGHKFPFVEQGSLV